ncbi:MAG: TrmH family RNA methyltransferase [Bacteroidota bacterium]|nr:TrmH family RNA methyltransferase [Bacteroidota bacterium]
MEKITSLQNARVKNVVHLSKARERKDQNIFVAEGFREILKAVDAGFNVKELYFSKEVNLHPESEKLFRKIPKALFFEVTKAVFEKMAYRENSDGLIALIVPRYLKPTDLKLPENPLILVLESVEKPGNLGAILRTADAAALDAIIVCDPQTDIYNPNVIRSSLGCIFPQQVATCTTAEALSFLRDKGIKSFAAALTAQQFYHETDFTVPSAIVMGTEADGLTEAWLNGADMQVKIPMCGVADSLNVSTSAAILIFEAKRQRGF